MIELDTVPCEVCGQPTPMMATKRCDPCWQLESHIRRNPALARRILQSLLVPGMAITDDVVLLLRTDKGGWDQAGLDRLGVPWPPPHGWRRELQRLDKAGTPRLLK